ncbi:zinc-dependent alcohol dehydrogenase family protein [Okibacterium endophyticum]
MRAITYDKPESYELLTTPTPEPGPGEVLVRVTMTGICGTDVHIHHGNFGPTYPLVAGHEILGTVERMGPAVTGLAIGERVVYDTMVACGVCGNCQRQLPNYCTDIRAVGVTEAGGFADFVIAVAARCHSVEGIPDDIAVFAEPLACSLHAMDVLALKPGSDVLLFGAGPSGLLLAQLLRHGGAGRLVVAAPTQNKLDLARSYAADEVVLVDRHDAGKTISELCRLAPSGFDVVVDASGAITVLQNVLSLLRDGGTALVYGMAPEGAKIEIEPNEIFRRQLAIKGTFSQAYTFERALRMMRSGRIRTDGLITHRFGLETYAEAIDAVAHNRAAVKTVLVP